MGTKTSDVVPLSQPRSHPSEIADEAKAGAEKFITKNGESYVALIDAGKLDCHPRIERERIQLLLLEEVEKGLADVESGRVKDGRTTVSRLRSKCATGV
jgi:antitoxin (DNA-binding transcriptional repressor) of toxin-antitoxin stability system